MNSKKLLESLEKDPELKARFRDHLYNKKPLFGEDSPFSDLLQTMVNHMLEGEMESHMETESSLGKKNKRNGKITKEVISEAGKLYIETPRDRLSEFDPQIIAKRERTLSSGLDEQILALYAQGNSIEDVKRILIKIYGVEVSAGKISQITDKVLPEIESWRNRELSSFYPIVYLDAIHFKVRRDGKYGTSAFYTVYSVDWEGQRDLLGLYVQASEGASKWGLILEDLKSRGLKDILVVCTDNLKGFSEVISEVYPASVVQKCVVHQVRNSLKYVDEKDRKKVASDLRLIYTSRTEEQAKTNRASFEEKWGEKYSYIVKQWIENWDELMAFLDFPLGMRKMIYTTNPVEALHRIMRKLIKSKAAWVSETALIKQLYLSLMHNKKSWCKQAYGWTKIQRDIMDLYPERIKEYF